MTNSETKNNVKYPEISLQLSGQDGNAFSILGRASRAMKNHGLSKEEIDEFMTEAKSGDYNDLLRTCMDWFDCN